MVVERVRCVVSELGGAGRKDGSSGVDDDSTDARHKKHSPVP
jgi:hypothetical protein